MFEQHKKESPIISLLGVGGGIGSYTFIRGVGGYNITRSLRFNSADSAYLSRTPASAGNRKTWTWAGWVKRSKLGAEQSLFTCYTPTDVYTIIRFFSGDALSINQDNGGGNVWSLTTARLFRDPSAWYHIVLACDTTIASPSSDRIKLYVNGSRVTEFSSASYPSQNLDTNINRANEHLIGQVVSSFFYSGYLADIHFIDGQALDPTSFGEFDANGVWQPIEYTGTYPGNSFHLPFSDNSTAAALGTDTSGAGNDWDVYNISVNQSTVNYNSTLTAVNPSETVGSPENAFDDNLSTTITGIFGGIKFTPLGGSQSGVTSLRFYSKSFGQGGRIKLNGTIIENNYDFGSGGWYSFSSTALSNISNTLTSFEWDRQPGSGSNNNDYLYAIEINGTVLVNTSSADNDSLVDTPTNGSQTDTGAGGEVVGNYATLNPLDQLSSPSLTNGNLDLSMSTAAYGKTRSTIGFDAATTTGYYAEITITGSATDNTGFGVIDSSAFTNQQGNAGAKLLGSRGGGGGNKWWTYNGTSVGSDTGVSHAANQVIGIAIKNGKVYFAINNTWVLSGNPSTESNPAFSGLTGTLFLYFVCYQSNALVFNAGARPFAYTAPSGYKALCTANLDDPLVALPSTVMDVALYTGNGSTQTISGLGFSPDFVWIKHRSVAGSHNLFDQVRGTGKVLFTNSTSAEGGTTGDLLGSFNSDGFQVNVDYEGGFGGSTNNSGDTYVAWTWDAGSSTVTNTQGSITSSVRANPSAGFSIVTYTGNGSAGATIGHGLNVAPELIIVKVRTQAYNWFVYHKELSATKYIKINTTDAAATLTTAWNNTAPTSTVLSVGTDGSVNQSSATYVAYCFAPVEGYSAFGSYTGNGSTDGPFVFCNFLPRYILIKPSSISNPWSIYDTQRSAYNQTQHRLNANDSQAEQTNNPIDILSNGFKLRDAGANINQSGATYIYAAFAESPQKFSRAR